mmetsp:Transcript_20150/g.22810  ORF Transcript_20150/g.22810 Transcript_20150/m.22810 type:complete len:99 (+) Transcript_20150:389-685(+)
MKTLMQSKPRDPENDIELSIKVCPGFERFKIQCNYLTRIEEIKRKVFNESQGTILPHCVIYAGHQLQDDRNIQDYGLQAGCLLFIIANTPFDRHFLGC